MKSFYHFYAVVNILSNMKSFNLLFVSFLTCFIETVMMEKVEVSNYLA